MLISKKCLVLAAVEACSSFAKSSKAFFNFDERKGWRGWENWLTVEIIRRLNNDAVIPFHPYGEIGAHSREKMDIYVKEPFGIAVEIKVNYIDWDEIECSNGHRPLPKKIKDDAAKLQQSGQKRDKLLLISTCFQDRESLRVYRGLVRADIEQNFKGLSYHKWYDCSTDKGFNLLLALSSSGGLPRAPK